MFQLRPYQELLIEGARLEFKSGKKRTCIVSPCGSGKTLIMAYMASQARIKGNSTLFVVHRQELIKQSSVAFSDMGISHGIIAANTPMSPDELIQIASIQTVIRRTDRVLPPDIIILDESHHATAATWRKLLDTFPQAFVIGLTATPARMGGAGLGDIFESLIIGPSVQELVSWGNLSPYKYFAPPVKADLTGLRVAKYGDYDKKEVAIRMDNSEIIGDIVKQYQKLAPGARAVCYCASIAHSKHTANIFREFGVEALHIDGETSSAAREAAINDFRTGKIKILCNVDLISEGFDVPSMEAVILARPTQSLTLYIQQSMRAMRADKDNPGKVAVIIDHVGNLYRHGLPDEERQWTLEGKKKGEKIELPLKQCCKCYAAHRPAPVCPYCGYIYPGTAGRTAPKQRDGDLAEVIELERIRKKEEVRKARDIITLEQIALARGYNPNWVVKQCELKRIPFGRQDNKFRTDTM